MKILIKNGIVNDLDNNIKNEKLDILIDNNIISNIAKSIDKTGVDNIIDASNLLVYPGFIDMHVHLRDPGETAKEDIESGSKSAAAGGFTSIVCMANTKPPLDTAGQIKYVVMTAKEKAVVNVYPYGAVTKGLEGEVITEMGDMLEAGAVAFSDDGRNIAKSDTMRRALEYLIMFDKPIIVHAEDEALVGKGSMHESDFSARHGLHGIPYEAEEVIVARDILLSRLTNGKVHITHTSSAGSVEMIRYAKAQGLKVTADCTPHHLALVNTDVGDYDSSMKVRPPLREEKDTIALRDAILDGTIDAVATDHAPHTEFQKSFEFNIAPNGMIGLETSVPIVLDKVAQYKDENYPLLSKIMSSNPAKILGIKRYGLKVGEIADITIIDPNEEYVYSKDMIVSKAKNSPFLGKKLKGKAKYTIVSGKVVYPFA